MEAMADFAEQTVNTSDVSFMVVCSALVQLMTPGLALFYGGLVHHRSVCAMMAQNFISMGITSILWTAFVFSLAFGEKWGETDYDLIGSPFTFLGLRGVDVQRPLQLGTSAGTTVQIPGVLFVLYQCMFAVITPALMTGAFADRLRFLPWMIFLSLWLVLVYAPWCHQLWGGGFLMQQGVFDFAGGIVVHITAGFSALAAIVELGERPKDLAHLDTAHSVPLVFIGTGLLWFGWFGFNAGSANAASSVAVVAAWNSQVAAATAMTVWSCIDWVVTGKPSLIGLCVGAVAGLATVTPAAGFIQPGAALLLGAMAAPVCYCCVTVLNKSGLDDALDVWGVHGMGGFLGTTMLGYLADGPECHNADATLNPGYCVNPAGPVGGMDQLWKQLLSAFACAAYSFLVTYMLLKVIGSFMELKLSVNEQEDVDGALHGEAAYAFEGKRALVEPLL